MPWLKVVHIIALVSWSASLIYLPALVAAQTGRGDHAMAQPFGGSLIRDVFTLVATPLALLTIASGTALFLVEGALGLWLILKLTLVAGMVLLHVWCGALILQAEHDPAMPLGGRCVMIGVTTALLISGVLYLVLDKPA
ncbi:CopD family protein [Caldimonas tepidiphila]|uniref:CopD family protein n=1 Tax=Caldimonas tepidiphila TaxID=2315841 RepID=UPI000E5B6B3C|nr:CopD family protein [Caldimonas tepidiphila]